MACVVKADQKSKIKEILEEKPEITTGSAEIAVEESIFNGVNITRHGEKEIEIIKESKAVVSEGFSEDNLAPVISISDNEQPLNDGRVTSDVIIDENQARHESNQTVVNAEEDNSVKHNIEQDNALCSHSDKNGVDEDFHDEKVDENNGCDRKAVDDTGFFEPVVENGLEEKPARIENSKTAEETNHVIKLMNEEKPAVSSSLRTSREDTKAEKINEDFGNKLVPVTIDKDSDITSHETSRISDVLTRDHEVSTVSDLLREVTLKEPTTSVSTEILESKQLTEKTNLEYPSKENDDVDNGFAALNGKTETLPAACVTEEKPVIKSKESPSLVTRTRAHSEQRSGTESALVSQDIASALRSGSLESLRLHRQHEDAKGSQASRLTYSPPANSRSPVGHLRREKRPARMLRNSSFDVVGDVFDLRVMYIYISLNCNLCSCHVQYLVCV